MNKILLGFTTLLVAMTLSLCTPDPPEGPATVKKISIMGDSYSTFEGWSNDYFVQLAEMVRLN